MKRAPGAAENSCTCRRLARSGAGQYEGSGARAGVDVDAVHSGVLTRWLFHPGELLSGRAENPRRGRLALHSGDPIE